MSNDSVCSEHVKASDSVTLNELHFSHRHEQSVVISKKEKAHTNSTGIYSLYFVDI